LAQNKEAQMNESIRAKRWGRRGAAASGSRTKKSYAIDVNADRPARTASPSRVKPTYDPKRLMDLALFYCSKRETSRPKLQMYLTRKVNLETQPEAKEWIETILQEFERLKVIDHERYAGMLNREYIRRGKGKRYIEQKLKERGVGEQTKEIAFAPEDELERATTEARKALEKTAFKKIDDPYLLKQKLLMKMVTLGFDYGVAKKAVDVALKKE
jgi:SOS response regulatory protein OraA/RecX